MMLSAATVFAAFVAAQAASLPGSTPNLFNRELSARQDVPAACVRSCGPVNSLITNGCPPASCCRQEFVQGFMSCYVCVGTAAGVTDYSAGEASIHELAQRCATQGMPINEIPWPRPASGTTTTSSGASGTGTTSTSSTASPTFPTLSQTTVTSLTSPPPTSTSQTVVTSIDTTSTPTPAVTDGGNSGGNGNGAAAIVLSGAGPCIMALAAVVGASMVLL